MNKSNTLPKNKTLEQKKCTGVGDQDRMSAGPLDQEIFQRMPRRQIGKRTMNAVENDMDGTTVFWYS